MIQYLLLFLGAICIGVVSAIAGIGGGSLMVPFMVLVLGYDVKTAIATSLICITVTSSIATSVYLREKLVDIDVLLLLEPASALGAITGAYLTLSLPARIVKGLLGSLLLYVSISMFKRVFRNYRTDASSTKHIASRTKSRLIGVTVSYIAGLFSGMFGIGGGILKVPIMVFILSLPIKTAVATSAFMVGLTACSGGIVYLMRGYVDPLSVMALALGIIPGAMIGAKLLKNLKPWIIRLVFSIVLLYASLRLLYTLIG